MELNTPSTPAGNSPHAAQIEAVEKAFTYHPPFGTQTERYVAIRDKGKELALMILELTPSCADQTAAIRKVREAVMTANAAIAINEAPIGVAP